MIINSRQQKNGSERGLGTGLPEMDCALRLKHASTRDRRAFRKTTKNLESAAFLFRKNRVNRVEPSERVEHMTVIGAKGNAVQAESRVAATAATEAEIKREITAKLAAI